MHRTYKKEYNVILRSFISRAFVGTIVVSSLFACGGVSREELEAIERQEKSADNEAKSAKEETEKVKKELGDKITALEGRAPADINATQYENIQAAVGLDTDGRLDASKGVVKKYEDFLSAVQGSLGLSKTGALDNDTGLAGVVKALNEFNKVIQASVGLDGTGTLEPDFGGSLAEDVKWLKAFKTAIQASLGLDDTGRLDPAVGGSLAENVAGLRTFKTAIQASVGLNDVGVVNPVAKGSLAETVKFLKNFRIKIQESVGLKLDGTLEDSKGLAKTVAALPAKIVKGVNALGAKIELSDKSFPKIDPNDLL